MYEAVERNKNYSEKEVKLNEEDDQSKESIICTNINSDKIPNFYWEAFNSEIYCLEYRWLKNPIIFTSNNQNNAFKIYNLFALELCQWNLELPLPNIWNIQLSTYDILKDKYLAAKRMQLKLRRGGKKSSLPSLEKSKSQVDIPQTKVLTYSQLLKKVENSMDSDREPLRLSLRRIEAKRRPLLYDENNHEGQFLIALDKRIKQRTEDLADFEDYERRMLEAQKSSKIENLGTALVSNKDKDIIRTVWYEDMVDEITKTQYAPQEDMK